QDSGDLWSQHDIYYLMTEAEPIGMNSVKTGWQDEAWFRSSTMEASGHWGSFPYADLPPTMRNGIGRLDVSLHIEDYRALHSLSPTMYTGDANVPLKFKQRSGFEPLQLTTGFVQYNTRGGGSLQVSAAYTPGGQVRQNGQVGYAHSIVLQFTYSSNLSKT